MPKCVICGAEFPHHMVSPKYSTKKFPQEICAECASDKPKPAVRRKATNNIINYCELAGAIERLVLKEYRSLYKGLLNSMARYGVPDVFTNKERFSCLPLPDNQEGAIVSQCTDVREHS